MAAFRARPYMKIRRRLTSPIRSVCCERSVIQTDRIRAASQRFFRAVILVYADLAESRRTTTGGLKEP